MCTFFYMCCIAVRMRSFALNMIGFKCQFMRYAAENFASFGIGLFHSGNVSTRNVNL